MTRQLHPQIEARLRTRPPIVYTVPGSTPVPSFGDAERATTATLGINPSCAEFADRAGRLLAGSAARFVSLTGAGVNSLDEAPLRVVERVYEGCVSYFHRNPYRLWFDRLEEQLRPIGASYYDGSAAHLDLVHWATNPVWGKLPVEVRSILLSDGRPFIQWQLSRPHLKLVLLNGRTVLDAFASWSGGTIEIVRELTGPLGRPARLCRVRLRSGPLVLGWSTNLQSSFGVTKEFRRELSVALCQAVQVSTPGLDVTTLRRE